MQLAAKRARTMDKQERLINMDDELRGQLAVLQTEPAHAIQVTLTRLANIGTLGPNLQALDQEAIKSLSKALTSTSNVDHRYSVLAKAVFRNEFGALQQLEGRIKMCKTTTERAIAFMVMKTYGNDNGVIDWQQLNEDLLNLIG